jgi:hypothetical protein
MFLGLLLECGNNNKDTVTLTEEHINNMLTTRVGYRYALDALQSLQLVTVEEIENPLQKRNEMKRKEEKGKEKISSGVPKAPPPAQTSMLDDSVRKNDTEANRKVFEAYRDAYFHKYKVEIKRGPKINGQISYFVRHLGQEDAVEVVKFYMTHNDYQYTKNTHSFDLCLKTADTLRTQMLMGKKVTGTTARNIEKTSEGVSQVEYFERMAEREQSRNN